MKLIKNNQSYNFIKDNDILITSGVSSIGTDLSNVISKQQKDIDTLKSNVKWIYKYGGVGSGSGSGGSSKTWGINALLDGNVLVNGSDCFLGRTGNFDLSLSVANNDGTKSFYVTYEIGTIKGNISLNSSNGWKATITLTDINTNNNLTITYDDGSLNTLSLQSMCIVKFIDVSEISLVDEDGTEYTGSDIFIEQARERELWAKMPYTIALKSELTYSVYINNIQKVKDASLTLMSDNVMYQIPNEYLTEDKNGLYNIQIVLNVVPSSSKAETTTVSKDKNFNLIPLSLYLKIEPEEGKTIYDEVIESDYSKYSVNYPIYLFFSIYKGTNLNRGGGYVHYDVYDTDGVTILKTGERNGLVERINYSINFEIASEGWHKVVISCSFQDETKTYTKYLYTYKVNSTFNFYTVNTDSSKNIANTTWNYFYNGSTIAPSDFNYTDTTYVNRLNQNDTIVMTSSSDEKVFSLVHDDISREFCLSIGIQYNFINEDNIPIISFATDEKTSENIIIYQDKVQFFNDNQTVDIYLEKNFNFDSTDASAYHVIDIVCRFADKCSKKEDPKYQYLVYMDGVLEGALTNFLTFSKTFKTITLKQGQYAIKMLEYHSFLDKTDENYHINQINDFDVLYHYYSFMSLILNDEEYNKKIEADPIMLFKERVDWSIENDLLMLNSSIIKQLVGQTNTACMMFECQDEFAEYQGGDLYNFLNSTSGDPSTLKTYKWPITSLYFARNKVKDDWDEKSIVIPSEYSGTTNFYFGLQGSTTMNYKAKNFTLGLKSTNDDILPLFSPNFSNSDYNTFLPETRFTLKADFVDSSHSNNDAMGKFINDVSNYSHSVDSSKYSNWIKKCLVGFPCLLFFKVHSSDVSEQPKYYYLGVYNFNLGRESYFNLGYSDGNLLGDNLQDTTNNTFTFSCITDTDKINIDKKDANQPVFKDNLIVTEIQNKNSFWDFSQYDNSILFQLQNEQNGFMFDDFCYGKNFNNEAYKNPIKEFVKSISKTGGFLFDKINKIKLPYNYNDIDKLNSSEYNFGYNKPTSGYNIGDNAYGIEGTVPDYRVQYKRTNKDGVETDHEYQNFKYKFFIADKDDIAKVSDLSDCLLDNEIEGQTFYKRLHYETLVYYYLICMAFGLTDSVQKNLNLKTWNGRTFGAYFYDMDTCLGIDNQGGYTSFYCFSDYWVTSTSSTATKIDGKDVINNNGCTVKRDYWPTNISGYDVPSSYLFAIAKYLHSYTATNGMGAQEEIVALAKKYYPENIWSAWRSPGGVLENVDNFMDKYFVGYLSEVPDMLKSFNYRVKYLYNNVSSGAFGKTEIQSFHGRRISRTKEWLNNRIHLMDLYMNLIDDRSTMIGQLIIPTYDSSEYTQLTANDDIEILKDIFTPKTYNPSQSDDYIQRTSFNAIIKSKEYSPMAILDVENGNAPFGKYIFDSDETYYGISFVSSSARQIKIGGSLSWTYINSLNPFIQSMPASSKNFYLTSKLLHIASGNSGNISEAWNFKTPSLEVLSLTNNSSYGGTLTIDDKFYNLKKIDISSTNISLKINDSSVQEINISGLKGNSEISIQNCKNITKFNMNQASMKSCSIGPLWFTSGFSMTNTQPVTVDISGNQNWNDSFTLINSKSLTSITLRRFKTVTLNDNVNLSEIYISADRNNPDYFTSFSCQNCKSLRTINIPISSAVTSLNLNGCENLTSLTLSFNSISDYQNNNITTLNLTDTKIKSIKFQLDNGTVISDSVIKYNGNDVLNLIPFKKLKENNYQNFSINQNTVVEYIQFPNEKTNPILLKTKIQNCNLLKRIFGNFIIQSNGAFYKNEQFTIHGENINTFNNYPIEVSGVTQMPWQWNNISSPLVYNTNGTIKSIVSSCNVTTANSGGLWDKLYQSGNAVTNMKFSGDTNGSCDSMFAYTNITAFDIYYFFTTILSNVKNLNSTFAYLKRTNIFSWDENKDNSLNRYLFYKCQNITSISSIFYDSSVSGRLLSPDRNANGDVTKDNGFLSPLSNLQGNYFGISWSTGKLYFDRYYFRRVNTNYTGITSLSYISTPTIFDNVNEINYSDLNQNVNTENDGNLSNFFDNIPNITNVTNIFYSTKYINYNNFPTFGNKITSIISSFLSSYAIGEIRINDYCTNCKSIIKSLSDSFYVSGTYSTITGATLSIKEDMFEEWINLENLGLRGNVSGSHGNPAFYGNGIKKLVYANNNNLFPYHIFDNCTKLTSVYGFFRDCKYILKSGTLTDINRPCLPGDMFKNTPKLTEIDYLFYNFDFNGNENNGNYYYTLSNNQPFSNCSNLTTASYAFASDTTVAKYPTLKSEIPNRFFFHGETIDKLTITGTNATYSYDEIITSEITGEETIIHHTYYGNDCKGKNNPEDNPYYNVEYDLENIEYLWYSYVNSNIRNLSYCFQHSNIDAYSFNEYPKLSVLENELTNSNKTENTDKYARYSNPNYTTSKYYVKYNGNGNKWGKNPNSGCTKYTFKYIFDGEINESTNGYYTSMDGSVKENDSTLKYFDVSFDEYSNNVITQNMPCKGVAEAPLYGYSGIDANKIQTSKYCCSPDLLLYAKNDAYIQGLFSYCGIDGWKESYPIFDNDNRLFAYGIKGRICPYLFNKQTNTTNFSRIFDTCRCLSSIRYYSISKDKIITETIPNKLFASNTKITDLSYAFRNLIFPMCSTVLTNTFSILKNSLNVSYIFYYCTWNGVLSTDSTNSVIMTYYKKDGTTETHTGSKQISWSNVFASNIITNCSYAFCYYPSYGSRYRTEAFNVKFTSIFNSVYKNASYGTSTNINQFKRVFYGYPKGTVEEGNFNIEIGNHTMYFSKANENYSEYEEDYDTND